MIVLDASALVELLLATSLGHRIARRVSAAEATLHAPHLVDLEVAQTVRRYALAGEVDAQRALLALAILSGLDLERHPHEDLLPRIWELRHNCTAYDAAYVSLAEALDAPLLTCDRRLAAAPLGTARVELVE